MNIISFDIDGVVAQEGFVPEWDRTPERYAALRLRDDYTKDILNQLTWDYHVYLVSGRRFPKALDITRDWLERWGIHSLCGVIVGAHRQLKSRVLELIGSQLHFDDDPQVVREYYPRSVYFKGQDWQYHEDKLPEGGLIVTSWLTIPDTIKGILYGKTSTC